MINIVILKDNNFYQRSIDVYDRYFKYSKYSLRTSILFRKWRVYIYELKKENRVLRSKLIRSYNKFAHENTNELSFVESENTPTKNDDTNSILDDIDDDTNSILDDIDDIKDIPKIDLKTIELVREEIPSTELDYFEMIISEDDIIF